MSRRVGDDEVVANIFARAYRETGSIADAFWITEAVVRRKSTNDVASVGLNQLIADVAAARGIAPKTILGTSSDTAACEARWEVWWRARQIKPPLSYPALGAAFDRDHTTVLHGVRRFDEMISKSVELRARMTWALVTGRAA